MELPKGLLGCPVYPAGSLLAVAKYPLAGFPPCGSLSSETQQGPGTAGVVAQLSPALPLPHSADLSLGNSSQGNSGDPLGAVPAHGRFGTSACGSYPMLRWSSARTKFSAATAQFDKALKAVLPVDVRSPTLSALSRSRIALRSCVTSCPVHLRLIALVGSAAGSYWMKGPLCGTTSTGKLTGVYPR